VTLQTLWGHGGAGWLDELGGRTDVGSCGKREGKGWPRLVGANRCTATGQSLGMEEGMEEGGRVREAVNEWLWAE
jgi:hypothetical protein